MTPETKDPIKMKSERAYFNFGLVRVTQDFNLFRVWNRNTGDIRHFHDLDSALAFAKAQPAANGHNVWATR